MFEWLRTTIIVAEKKSINNCMTAGDPTFLDREFVGLLWPLCHLIKLLLYHGYIISSTTDQDDDDGKPVHSGVGVSLNDIGNRVF